ncbi:MxaD protein [Methylophaga frappieri]|uniref:MxaD protein n=1 Tax=Methylophaga frappieri (strain ATCC BAA-2434 / DSM 25690 / JAM7) TaxID=754477 RepID=I1YK23_METFJ|nr:SRPBCC family protein [Methylophaga frappieri]AFJ03266.1 MxaD protein [Methylophaga frappieri]
MNKIKLMVLFFALWMTGQAYAHGPTPQKVDESITIAASADEVWEVIGEFGQIGEWHPHVEAVENTDETTRVITLASGEKFTESLDDRNADEYLISYRLLEENFDAIPVSFFTISIQAESSAKNETTVSWSGRFYRADTGNFPPENLNDAAAVKAMTEYAQAGLQGIKDAVEK